MPQQMTDEEVNRFWIGQDLVSGKALELGVPPKDVQMEEVGERVMWGPAIEPALEGPPLAPLVGVPNEESGALLVQEGGAVVDDDAVE